MAYIVLFCRAPEESKTADGKPSLQQSPKLNTPVLRAHVDYSASSGPRRLKDVMKDEAEQLGKTPFGILQVRIQPHLTRTCSTSFAFKHCDCFYSCCSYRLACQPDSSPAGPINIAVQNYPQAQSPI